MLVHEHEDGPEDTTVVRDEVGSLVTAMRTLGQDELRVAEGPSPAVDGPTGVVRDVVRAIRVEVQHVAAAFGRPHAVQGAPTWPRLPGTCGGAWAAKHWFLIPQQSS